MRMVSVSIAALFLSVAAYAQLFPVAPVAHDTPFQINYATNLGVGDSFVTLTNSGASSTVATPVQNGNLCINVYTYDPAEELVSCCSCPVTPNGLEFLSVKNDLIARTLTPAIPSSVVIKLVSSSAPTCNPATVGRPGNLLAPGMVAWGTTLAQTSAGVYTPERTPFTPATLSGAELNRMTTLCGFIQSNGSGYGICASCRPGAAGGAAKQ
jgi:hypothetical protein